MAGRVGVWAVWAARGNSFQCGFFVFEKIKIIIFFFHAASQSDEGRDDKLITVFMGPHYKVVQS